MNLFERLLRVVESWISTYDSGSSYSQRQQDYSYRKRAYSQPKQDPEIAGYYANLEIPYGSDLETVKAAWKKQMRRYHPDLHANDPEKRKTAELLTQRLNTAYERLTQYLAQTNH